MVGSTDVMVFAVNQRVVVEPDYRSISLIPMRIAKKIILFLILFCLTVFVVRQVIVTYPMVLFGWKTQSGNLILYSDQPFEETDGVRELETVRGKLQRSPLYSEAKNYRIFLCNRKSRRALLFFPIYEARGLNYPCVRNAFLCGGVVKDDALLLPNGTVVRNGLPLSYYATHEITHSLTNDTMGVWKYMFIPEWIREGYADYVGRGSLLKQQGMVEAFLADAPEMNFPAKAPYMRFNILVGYCLETLGMSEEALLCSRISRKEIETRVRVDFEGGKEPIDITE